MSEIDWKVLLRNIEREFDGLPPEPSPAELRVQPESGRGGARHLQDRAAAATTHARAVFARLFLVVALGAAINWWPYAHECGAGLFAYVGAEVMIVAGGLWVAAWTWRAFMAKTHALSMVLVLWGLTLIAAQALPRVGYAKVDDPKHPPRWRCSA